MSRQLFGETGVHAVVDGQYGSTGKGALAAWLADQAVTRGWMVSGVISNAGPNSGHTFYTRKGEKVVLKQLPTFAVAMSQYGAAPPIILSAGAVIDPMILMNEAALYPGTIYVHPNAAVITDEDREQEHSGTVAAVAGTRSGTGAAIARKVLRDPEAVFSNYALRNYTPPNVFCTAPRISAMHAPYFMEVSQGFSLGLNQQFYPKCTSRECTVSQAMADAGLPPRAIAKTYMAIRTYPIRVGNVDGYSSGDWYPDQMETSWDKLGVDAERTTVTNRVRRVATFSTSQFMDAIRANDPDFVFVNFMNYVKETDRAKFVALLQHARAAHWRNFEFIEGHGPTVDDVRWQ